ncbi:MAG TPA: hypothetical protein PLB16_06590, partial [bacterium]|nr:hypothetical protein [bacterium]
VAQDSEATEKDKISTTIPVKKKDSCGKYSDSYNKNVIHGRKLFSEGKEEQGINYLKRHLKCWYDEEIYFELAGMYETQQKYYLAGLALKEAGMTENFNRIETKRKAISTFYDYYFKDQSAKFQAKSFQKKVSANFFFLLGGVTASTGLGLFISDKGFNKSNSLSAQYSLILGGLSFVGAGLALNASSQYDKNTSKAYLSINGFCDMATTTQEYYQYSGLKSQTMKMSGKTLKSHGIALISLSIPLFAVSIFSFFDSYRYRTSNRKIDEDCYGWCGDIDEFFFNLGTGMMHFYQLASILPAVASLAGGIYLVVIGSAWENIHPRETILTLNSISPIIDPVSRTYGLSAGFSF